MDLRQEISLTAVNGETTLSPHTHTHKPPMCDGQFFRSPAFYREEGLDHSRKVSSRVVTPQPSSRIRPCVFLLLVSGLSIIVTATEERERSCLSFVCTDRAVSSCLSLRESFADPPSPPLVHSIVTPSDDRTRPAAGVGVLSRATGRPAVAAAAGCCRFVGGGAISTWPLSRLDLHQNMPTSTG